MSRLLFLCLVLVASALPAQAETTLFFKISVDGKSYSTLTLDGSLAAQSKLHMFAAKLRERFFDPARAKKHYYDISVHKGFQMLGKMVDQYELTPVKNDRFRQIIWLIPGSNAVVRREVYDLTGKLVYAYGYSSELPDGVDSAPVTPKSADNRIGDIEFRGFIRTEVRSHGYGATHHMFSDGLNKISLFIQPRTAAGTVPEERKVMYGNYVLHSADDSHDYTAVGTAPFETMAMMVAMMRELIRTGGKPQTTAIPEAQSGYPGREGKE